MPEETSRAASYSASDSSVMPFSTTAPVPISPAPISANAPVFAAVKSESAITADWSKAPPAVRDARILAFVGSIVYSLLAVWFILLNTLLMSHGRTGSPINAISFSIVAICNIYLVNSLRKGEPETWRSQKTFSILGLLAFPLVAIGDAGVVVFLLGAILNLILLSKWSRPETKAWFGVP